MPTPDSLRSFDQLFSEVLVIMGLRIQVVVTCLLLYHFLFSNLQSRIERQLRVVSFICGQEHISFYIPICRPNCHLRATTTNRNKINISLRVTIISDPLTFWIFLYFGLANKSKELASGGFLSTIFCMMHRNFFIVGRVSTTDPSVAKLRFPEGFFREFLRLDITTKPKGTQRLLLAVTAAAECLCSSAV